MIPLKMNPKETGVIDRRLEVFGDRSDSEIYVGAFARGVYVAYHNHHRASEFQLPKWADEMTIRQARRLAELLLEAATTAEHQRKKEQ